MQRFLNMFNVIGALLLVIGLLGFASGGRWVAETGTHPTSETGWIYFGAGLLMLANGFMSHVMGQQADVNQKPTTDEKAK